MNVSLFTVRHVFVEFVKGMESGIRNPESGMRNPECGIRNPFPFIICGKSFRIYNVFCISFFKVIECYAGSLRSLLSLL